MQAAEMSFHYGIDGVSDASWGPNFGSFPSMPSGEEILR